MRICVRAVLASVATALGTVLLMPVGAADSPKPATGEQMLEPFVTHPIVAGFERFYAAAGNDAPTDLVPGGRVLLGDLGCIACHRVEGAASQAVTPKQAPVLDGVGSRVRLAFIRELLANPQKAKPGTTMPDLLAGLPEAERTTAVEALVHFLATTGGITDAMSEVSAIKAGEQHFHRFGCVACHAPRKHAGPLAKSSQPQLDDEDDPRPKVLTTQTLVPLGDLTAKYSLPSLAKFLQDPLSVRPSGRMPGLGLQDKETREIAAYFFKDHKVPPNLNYAYFEGDWQKLPDFDAIKPNATGTVSGFDLGVTKRPNNFAIRFTGFLHIAKPGQYQFWLGSDDGSRLLIDGKEVVNVDGVHPHSEKEGRVSLDVGPYPIAIEYFQGGGEWTLSLEYQGQGVKRQSLASAVTLEREPPQPQPTDGGKAFELNVELAAKGRLLFATIGCAACHKLQDDGNEIVSELKPKPLAKTQASGGCLSAEPQRGLPHYRLTQLQRLALSAAMTAVAKTTEPLGPAELIAHSLTTFNCYACHVRDKVGGVEQVRNSFFETAIPEMGDEGRIPPALDGVGDKLREDYLHNLLSNGAKDRPYMHARMPKFNLGHLAKAFVTLDQKTAADLPKLVEPLSRAKSSGRQLVGEKGLSCVKCHPFNEHQATGIQAINLTSMTKRLREDWFYRYMSNPQDYRPGTRMPAPWPFGQATIKDVLDGDTSKQMRSVWTYLTDGTKAAIPTGIVREAIVLVPDKEPIIYRNFLEGLTPRGLAVGYPEGANLAFDVDRFALALIWQGAFIDASKHWAGRGPGNQSPLGDNVLSLPTEVPFAVLDDANQTWPTQSAKEQGYKFKGYHFDDARRPILQYQFGRVAIEDHLAPKKSSKEVSMDRKLSLAVTPGDPIKLDNLFYRAASGSKIETGNDGWFTVDSTLKVRLQSPTGSSPVIRQSGNRFELLVPVNLKTGSTEISQSYSW